MPKRASRKPRPPKELAKWVERAVELGATDAKIIPANEVYTAAWVRLKCQFGCGGYGDKLTCPPYSPTPEQTAQVIACYDWALLTHMDEWRELRDFVVDLEREVFLDGNYKALGFSAGGCTICKECNVPGPCRHGDRARPSMEAAGIDVFATARKAGFPIEVVMDYDCRQNYYGLILIR